MFKLDSIILISTCQHHTVQPVLLVVVHNHAGICHGRNLVLLGPGLPLDMPPAISVHPVLLGTTIFPLPARLPVIPSVPPVFPVWPTSTLQLPVLPATQCALPVWPVGVENIYPQSAPI